MLIAARTAPKGRGVDNIHAAIALGDTLMQIASHMQLMGERDNQQFYIRDANCVRKSPVMVLIGTSIKPLGLSICGLCGFGNCDGKLAHPHTPCVFNTHDLGIALGSAVSVAADCRVDNRIMFSAGMAVRELNLLGDNVAVIFAIPLSATGKNPFFDRA